jgi:hypothetical protein
MPSKAVVKAISRVKVSLSVGMSRFKGFPSEALVAVLQPPNVHVNFTCEYRHPNRPLQRPCITVCAARASVPNLSRIQQRRGFQATGLCCAIRPHKYVHTKFAAAWLVNSAWS